MKIKIITQNFPPRVGGIQKVMYSLANNFSKLGHKVHVMPDHFYSRHEKFKVTNLCLPKLFRPIAKKIYLACSNDKDHLVFCDTWKSVKAVPNKYNKIVVFAHGQEYLNYKKNQYRIAKSLLKTNFLISSSNYTLNLIKDFWDISNIKSTVIYPTYHISKSVLKNRIENKKINFISICRIEKRKGLLESLRCLRKVLDKGFDFNWNIIGNGPELVSLKNESIKLNLEKKIKFHGKIDNNKKEQYLEKSDIFLMPSFKDYNSIEGFGISYIEAARFGIPSIAGNFGGAKEAVLSKKTGWCVDTKNDEELVNALIESISNYKIRKFYGSNALKRFETEFSSDIVNNKLINFLKIN